MPPNDQIKNFVTLIALSLVSSEVLEGGKNVLPKSDEFAHTLSEQARLQFALKMTSACFFDAKISAFSLKKRWQLAGKLRHRSSSPSKFSLGFERQFIIDIKISLHSARLPSSSALVSNCTGFGSPVAKLQGADRSLHSTAQMGSGTLSLLRIPLH